MMANHYHLLVETEEGDLSRAMQWLNTSYAQGYNRKHRRVGHLLQGRFQGILVDWPAWGLELSRYLQLIVAGRRSQPEAQGAIESWQG